MPTRVPEDGGQRTEDRRRTNPFSVLRRPFSDVRTALDFSKRPVLLQTHPGALAVKPEPTTETLSGLRRKPKARSPWRSNPSLAPAPRPNAFPLHDVIDGRRSTEGQRTEIPSSVGCRRPNWFYRTSLKALARAAYPSSDLRRLSSAWWSQTGSNRRPHAGKARALQAEDGGRTSEDGKPERASSGVRLVEPDGIEPTTSCLQSTRSPN